MFFIRAIPLIAYLIISCAIPIKAYAEIIYDARVDNKDVKLLFDTGSEVTLLFNKSASRLKLDIIKRKSSAPAEPYFL